uniref:Zinc finger C3HC4 RING-type domain-containing protein n=1 Tax=viral metagenome TaxID=1070528 RepID=A0A6C0EM05_9ZZZZ
MSCKVLGCRYADTHVTKGHRCGHCYRYGHGRAECKDMRMKMNLRQYYSDVLPSERCCTINYCAYKSFHTTEGHFCHQCNTFNKNCSCNMIKIRCPFCRDECGFSSWEEVRLHGLTEKCNICLNNTIDTRLTCGHVMCEHCIMQMIRN